MKHLTSLLSAVALIASSSSAVADKLWVTCGTTEDLSARIDPRPCVVPSGKSPGRIVDIAIDGNNNTCFAWFRGTPRQVSGGSSVDLGKYRKPYTSFFPDGYDSGDVVGIAINESAGDEFSGERETTFVFFRDGKYTTGTTDNLNGRLYPYILAAGKNPGDIVSMAMDGAFSIRRGNGVYQQGLVIYTWYKDGTVSAGFMPTKLERQYGQPAKLDSWKTYTYRPPKNWNSRTMEIVGIGIDGENNHVYTWYIER